MNTRILMASSAATMGVAGLLALFLPHEILIYAGASASGPEPFIMQIVGGLYMGFAMMNWMARANLVGGIYSRPITIGNLFHFTVGALTLVKGSLASPGMTFMWIWSAAYLLFAVLFGLILFTHPVKGAD